MSKPAERNAAALFSALGDETRLALVRRLGAGVALSATALAEGAPVTRQAILKHLQVLSGAGLVASERQGREVLWSLEERRLAEARNYLDAVSARWDEAIDRLRLLVEPPPERDAATARHPGPVGRSRRDRRSRARRPAG